MTRYVIYGIEKYTKREDKWASCDSRREAAEYMNKLMISYGNQYRFSIREEYEKNKI